MKQNNFSGCDILASSQFTCDDIETVIAKTREMKDLVTARGASDELHGKIMTALFYEPSSRTFGSFVAAMQRLGGGFIPLQGVVYSSVAKGETLEDTIRTFSNYSDIIVLRNPEVGAAERAAKVTGVPIINAGDGNHEHPTQSLLDFFTITDHFGSVNDKTITMVGDLLNGRTIHSLITLLSLYKPKRIQFVAPTELRIPSEYILSLKESGIEFVETDVLDDVLADTEVLYMTRVQKERFGDLAMYEKLKTKYILTHELMGKLSPKAIVMHPFPRVGEIALDVDNDARSLYLTEQMKNGMYVRMALLSLMLSE